MTGSGRIKLEQTLCTYKAQWCCKQWMLQAQELLEGLAPEHWLEGSGQTH